MRITAWAPALALLLGACAATPVTAPTFESAGMCLAPSNDPNARSLPALVDRADIIVVATVVRTEAPPTPTGARDMPFVLGSGQLVTLRATETVKGTPRGDLVVADGPCPALGAKAGETLVAFLEGAALADGTYRPIGFPVSTLRATADRPLADLVAQLRAIAPLDGAAASLFARHGWTVGAKAGVDEPVVPAAAQFALAGREPRTTAGRIAEPFERYAALSATVGLDLRRAAGRRAELLTFFLDGTREDFREGSAQGHVLITDRAMAGAWVTVFPDRGTFAVSDRAGARAAATSAPAPWTPPANRVPQGINVAKAYDLASARSISFKTGDGRGAQITDRAVIRAFADALDVTLATAQAVDDRAQPATRYWFHVDYAASALLLQYDTADGSLSVLLDGWSARAPAAFAALVRDLR